MASGKPKDGGIWAAHLPGIARRWKAAPLPLGFGPSGEGYIRLTGFGGAEATKQAVERELMPFDQSGIL